MKNFSALRSLLAACLLSLATQVSAAPILQITGGMLMGAKNVDVNGTLYDVTFTEGSCASLFQGCAPSAFTFSNLAQGLAAANALLDQVFVDNAQGNFDAEPYKTNGCLSSVVCMALVPFASIAISDPGYFHSAYARNTFSEPSDFAATFQYDYSVDVATSTRNTYALFQLTSPASVPEPGSVALFGIALLGLAAARRRAK